MTKVGGRRNFGYGKNLSWAGANALKDRYGQGHFATQATHRERWLRFVEFAKTAGIRDARDITREDVGRYATALANAVRAGTLSVRYAQNLVSTVNVVLESMRCDRVCRVRPAGVVGERVNFRSVAPKTLDREVLAVRTRRLEAAGHERIAVVAGLARELGLRFREASLLNAGKALIQANIEGQIKIVRGTKGGRGKEVDRWVPVSKNAKRALERAATLQGNGTSIIPGTLNYKAWRNHAYSAWQRSATEAGPFGFHDMRVAYACERYRVLTHHAAPVLTGRRTAAKPVDKAARETITNELGHARIEVLSAYIGRPL